MGKGLMTQTHKAMYASGPAEDDGIWPYGLSFNITFHNVTAHSFTYKLLVLSYNYKFTTALRHYTYCSKFICTNKNLKNNLWLAVNAICSST